MTVEAFPMIEKAVKELIEESYQDAAGHVGGDPSYKPGDPLFVWIALIPGGSADETSGSWVLDIDVLADNYGRAMGHALGIEAALLNRKNRRTSQMIIDAVYSNSGPAERPWDDDRVSRIGATYAFTARRSG